MHLAELKTHASQYVQVIADKLRLNVQQAVVWGALGLLGSVIGAAALITATVMLKIGAGAGLGELLVDRPWAGNLIVGFVVLLGAGIACWLGIRKLTETSRRKTIDKYERQHYAAASPSRSRI
jgi:hypothetical protein